MALYFPSEKSLYDQLGLNDSTMRELVSEFYRRVTMDDLKKYFVGIGIVGLEKNQSNFLTMILGGKVGEKLGMKLRRNDYDVMKYLQRSHMGLKITGAHYDKLCDHLMASLTKDATKQLPYNVVNTLTHVFKVSKPHIVELRSKY